MKREIETAYVAVMIVPFIIAYWLVMIVGVLCDNLRVKLFGPRVAKDLLDLVNSQVGITPDSTEEERVKAYRGRTLCCDGEAWWYRDGRWQVKPESRDVPIRMSSRLNDDSSQTHREEWTDVDGNLHVEEYTETAEEAKARWEKYERRNDQPEQSKLV